MDSITIIQVLLTIFAANAGLLKLVLPYARFAKLPFQSWANEFKPWHVKLIGALEVGAAAGIIIPLLLSAPTTVTALAAIGLALMMAGAMATHLRRDEYLNVIGNSIWLGLALVLAYGTVIGFAV